MSEQRDDRGGYDVDEKTRETQEKEFEKHDEKEEKEEKTFEEKSRSDPVGSMVWAATLIWAGLLLLANNMGMLDSLLIRWGDRGFDLPFDIAAWAGVWQLFFLGAGALVLIGVVVRLLVPEYRRPVLGSLIWAIVLFGIALGQWELIWPLILIAVGVSMLFGGMFRRKYGLRRYTTKPARSEDRAGVSVRVLGVRLARAGLRIGLTVGQAAQRLGDGLSHRVPDRHKAFGGSAQRLA